MTFFNIIMDELNTYAPLITAAATVFIAIYAIINAKSLKISKEMLNFEKEKEIKEKEPHLVFYPTSDGFFIKNVGFGSALNIIVKHNHKGNSNIPHYYESGFSIRSLGAMDETIALRGPINYWFNNESYAAIAECEDVLGNVFQAMFCNGKPTTNHFFKIKKRTIGAPTEVHTFSG